MHRRTRRAHEARGGTCLALTRRRSPWLAGCAPATGVHRRGAGAARRRARRRQAGIAKLDFVVAHQSFCERWVGVDAGQRTARATSAAAISTKQAVRVPHHAVAHDRSRRADVRRRAGLRRRRAASLGEASFDAHPFAHGKVLKRQSQIFLFADSKPGGPQYVSGDGCVCAPGEPWVGNGSGTDCDTRVITSFDRLIDTAGCELTPKGAPLPVPVCDGQLYMDEPADRALPCWASDDQSVCRVDDAPLRRSRTASPTPRSATSTARDTMLPADSALCTQLPRLRADGLRRRHRLLARHVHADGEPQVHAADRSDDGAECSRFAPAPTARGRAALPTAATGATACPAAMLDGVEQPPYRARLRRRRQDGRAGAGDGLPEHAGRSTRSTRPIPTRCRDKEFDLVIGEHLTHVSITVVRECTGHGALAGMLGDVTTTARGGELHPLRLRRQDGAARAAGAHRRRARRWASSCSRATSARPTRSPR